MKPTTLAANTLQIRHSRNGTVQLVAFFSLLELFGVFETNVMNLDVNSRHEVRSSPSVYPTPS